MKKSTIWICLLPAFALMVSGCGNNQQEGNPYGAAGYGSSPYGSSPYGSSQYGPLSQYGQYQSYQGQQVWVPNAQPPQSWTPGQSYYQQGMPYSPPYYSYLNQPQNWQYNQGLGWNYRQRR